MSDFIVIVSNSNGVEVTDHKGGMTKLSGLGALAKAMTDAGKDGYRHVSTTSTGDNNFPQLTIIMSKELN